MTIEHLWETKRLLVIRYTEFVSGRELLNSALKISGDSRLDDLHYILSDWASVKKTKVCPDDVEELVAYISAISRANSHIKNASVTKDNEEAQSMVALYHHLAEKTPWKMKYFKSVQEAREWFEE